MAHRDSVRIENMAFSRLQRWLGVLPMNRLWIAFQHWMILKSGLATEVSGIRLSILTNHWVLWSEMVTCSEVSQPWDSNPVHCPTRGCNGKLPIRQISG